MRYLIILLILAACSEPGAPVFGCELYDVRYDDRGAFIDIYSDQDTIHAEVWYEFGNIWTPRVVEREYYDCWHIARETQGMRIRVHGCETELW